MSSYPTQIVEFEGQPVRLIRIDGVNYIPAEDLGKILGFSEPRKSVLNIFARYREELEPHSGVINLVTPGGTQEARVFTEIGAYLVAMFARTPRAREVRLWLARLPQLVRERGAEVLRDAVRQAIERAFALAEDISRYDQETLEKLVWLRCRAGLTQVEAGRVLGISRFAVQRIEKVLKRRGIEFPLVNEQRRRKEIRRYFFETVVAALPRAACRELPAELAACADEKMAN